MPAMRLKGGELKYHFSKLEFLALKWAMTEQFREYLQYQPFLIRTNNNPLTYVLTTPNLDTVGHRWVAAMAGYNFEIQYVCRSDNKVANALSHIREHLDDDNIKELLDQSTIKELLSHAVRYGVPRAESNDPRVTQEHEKAEGEIIMQAWMLAETKKNYQNLADSQWVITQRGDQAIRLVMDWLRRRKDDNRTLDQYLKHHIPDAECHIYAACQKDFVLRRNLLYLRVTPKRSNEDVLAFVVLGLKWQVAIDGCHRYLGHQGRDRTLSLLRERFWWPGMAQRMMMSVRNCPKCHIFEAKPQIPPDGAHPLYRAIGPGTHRLRVNGGNGGHKRETCHEECLGRRRPLHTLHPGVCHQQSYCAHYGTRPLQRVFLGVWVP